MSSSSADAELIQENTRSTSSTSQPLHCIPLPPLPLGKDSDPTGIQTNLEAQFESNDGVRSESVCKSAAGFNGRLSSDSIIALGSVSIVRRSPEATSSGTEITNSGDGNWFAVRWNAGRSLKLTEDNYKKFTRWLALFNLVCSFTLHALLYWLCTHWLTVRPPWLYSMPWGDNPAVVAMVTFTFGFDLLLLILCIGACLWKRSHPMVKARGLLFIVGVGLCAGVVYMLQYLLIMRYLTPLLWDSAQYNIPLYLLMCEYLTITLLLSLLVARERFLYCIFVRHPFERDIPLYRYYATVVGGIFIVSVCAFIPYLVTSLQENPDARYWALVVLIPWEVSIAMLAFYIYKTREINSKFSDHRANSRIGLFLALFSNLIVLRLTFWQRNDGPYDGLLPKNWELLFFYYASMFKTSYTITELFLGHALIAGCGVEVANGILSTWSRKESAQFGIASSELGKGEQVRKLSDGTATIVRSRAPSVTLMRCDEEQRDADKNDNKDKAKRDSAIREIDLDSETGPAVPDSSKEDNLTYQC